MGHVHSGSFVGWAIDQMDILTTDTILDRIMEVKRSEVETARERLPAEQIQREALASPAPRCILDALRGGRRMSLIAEVKKASPSKGVFRKDFDPRRYLVEYEASSASAISILTDEQFFQGSPDTLQGARKATQKPCLRKDFIFDEYQVWESRAWGADAVLLIVAVLCPGRLERLMVLARELEMTALVEVHTASEVTIAMDVGARLVGINNRDLKTFSVNLDTTVRLRQQIPEEVTVVSESGIETRSDVERLQEAGVQAVLVGETLIRAENCQRKIAELLGEGD